MIRSMTGFGTAEGTIGAARVTVELRAVNHRFFNPNIKLPNALSRWEGEVREAVRRGISRGRRHEPPRFRYPLQYDLGSPSECWATKFRIISRLTGAIRPARAHASIIASPYSDASPLPPWH